MLWGLGAILVVLLLFLFLPEIGLWLIERDEKAEDDE